MATITSSFTPVQQKHLRPFDPRRDLLAVADLIESCFDNTLDPDGRRYLRQMRAAGRGTGLNRWTTMATSSTSLPLAGYVWEAAGQVVGNLSLVPFFHQGRRIYLIANVAVKSDYRRRGIAKALTEAALEKSRRRKVFTTWLQVRDNNSAALGLYTKMGFKPRVKRTTWNAIPDNLPGEVPPGIRVTLRQSKHWPRQRDWLNQIYPPLLRWHFPLKLHVLQPGFWGLLHRFFNEVDVRHWAVQQNQQLLGVLSWEGTRGYADRLWLAAPPENDIAVLQTVLPFIRRERRLRRPLSLNYPLGRAAEILADSGFKKQHTLIWMEVKP